MSAALLLAGCGSNSNSGKDGQVTLRLTWWGNPARAEATQQAVRLFEKSHPNITVKVSPSSFPGYYDKLNTQFASGAAPDIFQSDQVATYAAKGVLLNLKDYKLDTTQIDPSYLNQGTIGGKLLEIPAGASPMAMVYQPAAFEKAGVTPPAADTTWEQLAQLAERIKAAMPSGTWALADSSAQPNHFQVFLRQRGKDWFNSAGTGLGFAAQDLKDWWQYWTDLRSRGLVPPADVSVAAASGDVAKSPVAAKKVAMSIYGTSVTLPDEDWRYGPLPNEAGHPGVFLMRSVSWAVSAKTKHPHESVQLVDFLLNDPEAGKLLGLSRGVPVNSSTAEAITPALSPKEKMIADYVAYLTKPGNSAPAPAPDPNGTRVIKSDQFSRHAQDVWFGKASLDKAVEQFLSEAERTIAAGA